MLGAIMVNDRYSELIQRSVNHYFHVINSTLSYFIAKNAKGQKVQVNTLGTWNVYQISQCCRQTDFSLGCQPTKNDMEILLIMKVCLSAGLILTSSYSLKYP